MRRRPRLTPRPLKVAPPDVETIEIHATDGHALRATVREPSGKVEGVAILGHAMFARRVEFERPHGGGLAKFLSLRGWRTIAFDFRGHGDSGPGAADGGAWSYDDLVERDLPAVVACARDRWDKEKIVVVGHSLGGHVALASQGTGRLGADAIAGFGSNVWLRVCEPSLARWMAKLVVARAMRETTERRGFFPARRLGLGSDDEASAYVLGLASVTLDDWWGSADKREDYWDALAKVKIPVMGIASDGDRLNCHPACAERYFRRASGSVTLEHIRAADGGGRAPGHMEMVTTEASTSSWARLERWMRDGH